jgi:phage-related protein
MYTTNPITGNVPLDEERPDVKIRWMGDTHERLKAFPAAVRHNLGGDLRRVQDGLKPLDGGPMPGIGPGVFELRDEDLGSWYRIIYLKKIKETIYVLNCFTKTSNQTSRQDVNTANARLAQVNEELLEERKDAKRRARHNG